MRPMRPWGWARSSLVAACWSVPTEPTHRQAKARQLESVSDPTSRCRRTRGKRRSSTRPQVRRAARVSFATLHFANLGGRADADGVAAHRRPDAAPGGVATLAFQTQVAPAGAVLVVTAAVDPLALAHVLARLRRADERVGVTSIRGGLPSGTGLHDRCVCRRRRVAGAGPAPRSSRVASVGRRRRFCRAGAQRSGAGSTMREQQQGCPVP